MTMILQTPQQRANTLYTLNVMWPKIPKDRIVYDLNDWVDRDVGGDPMPEVGADPQCGSPACFGGWCTRDPFFAAQGLRRDSDGVPQLQGREGMGCAFILFGDREVFAPLGSNHADQQVLDENPDMDRPEHAVVENRLRWLLANSEVVAEA